MATNREQWLNSAALILIDEIIKPNFTGAIPAMRYSMTAPKTGSKKVLGQCWTRAASATGINEIFITASLDATDSAEILAVLVHEQIHALDDCASGHKGHFAAMAKKVGLEGKMTATYAGPKLAEHLQEIIRDLGEIPHAALNAALNGQKKQKNRQLLVSCNHCEFKFRASKTAIESIRHWECPACNTGMLAPQSNEE
jgi:hypothetical protein